MNCILASISNFLILIFLQLGNEGLQRTITKTCENFRSHFANFFAKKNEANNAEIFAKTIDFFQIPNLYAKISHFSRNDYSFSLQTLSVTETFDIHVDLTFCQYFRKLWLLITIWPLLHNFIAFYHKIFLLAHTFWLKRCKANKSVSLKTVEL